jgi:hypothetical protein
VGICKKNAILIRHCVISRMLAPLKLIYSSIKVSDVLVLSVRCKLILLFSYSLFIPDMPVVLMCFIAQFVPNYFTLIL